MEELDRYSRQTIFPGIGPEGQQKLAAGFAVVVGCGALGTIISSALVRAGVGRVRVIDRDFIEYHNLQRQVLFTERDIEENLPKATAAERHLGEANSAVEVEGVVADFSRTNAEKLVEGADVIVDGLDNFETRFLINDVALKQGIPWVYGGAIGSSGMTATFLRGGRPCFRCLVSSPPAGGTLTCDTAGVVNAAPWIIGSLEAAEALKILIDDEETAPVEPRPGGARRVEPFVRDATASSVRDGRLSGMQRHLRVPPGAAAHPSHQPLRAERGPDLERGRGGDVPGRDQGAPQRSRTG